MTRRILVPYDGSEQAADALSHAVAAFPADEVVLLHVIEPYVGMADVGSYTSGQYEQSHEAAETMLEKARDSHEEADRIETATAVGRPVHEILGYTDSEGIDHVVIGSHGRDGAARLLLGSVAETVVRRAPVPVTVVRQAQQRSEPPEKLLVPFDGSTHSRRALTYALDRFEGADVTALYVLYPSAYTPTGVSGYEPETGDGPLLDEERHDYATGILETAADIASDHGREVETKTVEGKPAEVIVGYVEDTDVEHVVLGSAGRDGLTRLLLGSVAERVVRRSPVSVTVAK